MSLLTWRNEFSVGVPSVDYEHQTLIALINRLYSELLEESPEMTVMKFLGEIYTKISAHFALEEMLMREARYGEYAAHKKDHEHLLDDIRDIMESYEKDHEFNEKALKESLDQWFGVHFRTFDSRLHDKLGH